MAKFTMTMSLGLLNSATRYLAGDYQRTTMTSMVAVFTKVDESDKYFAFNGTDIEAAGNGITGNVFAIGLASMENGLVGTITGSALNTKALSQTLAADGPSAMFALAFKFNDRFYGSDGDDYLMSYGGNDNIRAGNGNDQLQGGKGRDVLSGQDGFDFFTFRRGDGRDVIRDFDPTGGAENQDYINYVGGPPKGMDIEKSGHDTLIDFGHGDSILLKGVNFQQVSRADFQELV